MIPYFLRSFSLVLMCALFALNPQTVFGQQEKAPSAPKENTLPAPEKAGIPRFDNSIQVDGVLDEAAWQKAAELAPFLPNNGRGTARVETSVRMGYDDLALYLAWTLEDPDIQATLTERDSKFWEEEVAECFITPGPLTRYFELQWNPLGGVFDAIIHNELDERGVSQQFKGQWDWTAEGMDHAVKVNGTVGDDSDQDTGWVAEVRLPFAALDQDCPKPGTVWRGNFYRYNRGKEHEPELLSWSPTRLPGFHQPSRFGYLVFGQDE